MSKGKKIKPDWSAAQEHLEKDPVLRRIIAKIGPCTLTPRRGHFHLLCQAIYSQQISTAVAKVLFARFCGKFPRSRPTPELVLRLFTDSAEHELKTCGLSRQKKAYLIDLARHFIDNRIPNRRLSRMSDEEITKALTAVHGIGRWTAEMFLMFVLNRPDILPADDLGLQSAVKRAYGLTYRPKPKQLTELAEPWRPYRTIASWYLWRAVDVDGGW